MVAASERTSAKAIPNYSRAKRKGSTSHLLGSKTRTSQDASIWLESNSGGRPAGSGCATAGGSGTARGLASSRRVGNVGRLGNCGRREGASRRTIDSDQLILLLVADWPIFGFGNEIFRLRVPHCPREANQPKIDTLYSTPPHGSSKQS